MAAKNTQNVRKHTTLPPSMKKGRKTVPKGTEIPIPNKEAVFDVFGQEEIDRQKHNEKMRRQMMRVRGVEPLVQVPSQELRKIDSKEMVEMSQDTRNVALQTLNKKLIELYTDEEALSKVNLATLATVFGILFDKTQLMRGLATENIAIQAKIDINMTSDDALKELNKMRESYNEVH